LLVNGGDPALRYSGGQPAADLAADQGNRAAIGLLAGEAPKENQ
jgi:hypothetical protein